MEIFGVEYIEDNEREIILYYGPSISVKEWENHLKRLKKKVIKEIVKEAEELGIEINSKRIKYKIDKTLREEGFYHYENKIELNNNIEVDLLRA